MEQPAITYDNVLQLLIRAVPELALGEPMSPQQRADAFEKWSAGHSLTPPLSDYAVSRESIYEGRSTE